NHSIGYIMASKSIVVEKKLLNSYAFESIKRPNSFRVYFCFLMKRKVKKDRYTGQYKIINNGEIVFTYQEAQKRLGISVGTFRNCIDELIGLGLINLNHPGSGGRKGDVSLYAISERWKKYGTYAFVKKTRSKDQREGRGFYKSKNNPRCRPLQLKLCRLLQFKSFELYAIADEVNLTFLDKTLANKAVA
ncbi:MAG: hypothetical protein ABFS32_21475, partial [Bacteroidota bacterium]